MTGEILKVTFHLFHLCILSLIILIRLALIGDLQVHYFKHLASCSTSVTGKASVLQKTILCST